MTDHCRQSRLTIEPTAWPESHVGDAPVWGYSDTHKVTFEEETLTPGSIPPQSMGFMLTITNKSDQTHMLGFPKYLRNLPEYPPYDVTDTFLQAKVQYFSLKCAEDLGLDLTSAPEHFVPVECGICEFNMGTAATTRSFTFKRLAKKPEYKDVKYLQDDSLRYERNNEHSERTCCVHLCCRRWVASLSRKMELTGRVDREGDKSPISATHMVREDEYTLKELLGLDPLASLDITHFVGCISFPAVSMQEGAG